MTNIQIKNILEQEYPVEYMTVGETAIDYMLDSEGQFSNDSTESGANLDLVEYVTIISGCIVTLKEGYDFIKGLSKDIRAKISPEEILREIEGGTELSVEDKKKLIRKVLTIVSDD